MPTFSNQINPFLPFKNNNILPTSPLTPPPTNPYAPLYNQGRMDVTAFPGIFGQGTATESLNIGNQLKNLLSTDTSPYKSALQTALLNPTFGASNPMEQSFLDSISNMTQGTSALRGLGPATPQGLGQALAPALMKLYQNHIQNLSGAYGQDVTAKGQTLQGLLELAGLTMPQYVGVPQPQRQKESAGGILGGLGTLLGGIGSLF